MPGISSSCSGMLFHVSVRVCGSLSGMFPVWAGGMLLPESVRNLHPLVDPILEAYKNSVEFI